MSKTYAIKGDWNATCEVCGFKHKASQLKKRWDGLMVCKEDWEVRHPMDLYRGPIGTESVVPWTSPEPTDDILIVCDTNGRSGIAGYAVAGCSINGLNILADTGIPTGTF